MKKRFSKDEAGGVLVMAMVVLTMLTLVGLMAIQVVAVEADVVGAERRAENALYIAEAGVQWGLQELYEKYDFDTATPDFAAIAALPVVGGASPWSPSQIAGWHELHSGLSSIAYGDGGYRVVVKRMDPPYDDQLLLRSFGVSGYPGQENSAKRMIEVAVVPGV